MFAGLEALYGMLCMVVAECGDEHCINVRLQKTLDVIKCFSLGYIVPEAIQHEIILVAPGHDVHVESGAALEKALPATKPENTKFDSLVSFEYCFQFLFHDAGLSSLWSDSYSRRCGTLFDQASSTHRPCW